MNARVVIITQEDLAKPCGYNRRIAFIAETLVQSGAEVTTVGWSGDGAPIAAGDVVVAGGRRALGKASALARGFAVAMERSATHVLIASIGAPYNGPFAWLLRAAGIRVIFDCQDPVLRMLGLLFGRSLPMRVALAWVAISQRLLDAAVSATFAAGPSLERMLRDEGWRGPILRVLNVHGSGDAADAADPSVRSRRGWENAKIVVYAGGLQRWRGLDMQIEAVALARARGADVRLMLVGFGDRAGCERYARECGLAADSAVVLDPVQPAQLYAVLAACDFAVSSEDVRYGMQSKIFDYLANGVRVLSIDDGRDINQYFGEFFRYFDGSADGLANLLIELDGRMTQAERDAARSRLNDLCEQSRANVRRAFGVSL